MWPRRRELVALVASWIVWSIVAFHVQDRRGSIVGYGDHVSHVGMARIFLAHGFDVYRKPGKHFCRQPPPHSSVTWAAANGCSNDDLCDIGTTRAAPTCIGWLDHPQPYPPGLFLASAPLAWLSRTRLSARALATVIVVQYLLTAHLFLWSLYRVVFASSRRASGEGVLRVRVPWHGDSPWLRWGLFSMIYVETMKWTLSGFYDPLALFPVFIGVYLLAERRPAHALLAFSSALFLHFRMLWYVPLFVAATLRLRTRVAWRRPAETTVAVLVAALLVGASLYAFFLVRHAVGTFPDTNPIFHLALSNGAMWDVAVPSLVVLGYLAARRYWLLLSTAFWQLFVVFLTPQTMNWHGMFLLPLLGVATLERGKGAMVAAMLLVSVQMVAVFGCYPMPGGTITEVLRSWGPWLGPP
jgi:hypothetical protein